VRREFDGVGESPLVDEMLPSWQQISKLSSGALEAFDRRCVDSSLCSNAARPDPTGGRSDRA